MTVQEAIEKYKTGIILQGKNRAAAQAMIKPGENVLWACDGTVTLGLLEKVATGGTIAITDQRIVFGRATSSKAGHGDKMEHYLEWCDVVRMSYTTQNMAAYLTVYSLTDAICFWCTEKKMQEGKKIIEQLVEQAKKQRAEQAATPAQVSSADELLKWKNLLDAGAITQAEYDAKKKQLLGL